MYYHKATTSAQVLLKAAINDVEKILQKNQHLNITNPELLIAAHMESATQIYIHEQLHGEHEMMP